MKFNKHIFVKELNFWFLFFGATCGLYSVAIGTSFKLFLMCATLMHLFAFIAATNIKENRFTLKFYKNGKVKI